MANKYKGVDGDRTRNYELSNREIAFIINALLDKADVEYDRNRTYSEEFTQIARILSEQQSRK